MLLASYEKRLNKNNKEGTVTKEYIEINGVRQGIIIESLNKEKPLLLFLHGGPGFPIYPFNKAHGIHFENLFNVCYWDQRGTGMSYNKKETDSPLNLNQLIEDTIEVVNYLRNKYSREKIFLMGHSWGSYLGSIVASKNPELFYAYIGVGQIGLQKDSEEETYNYILETAIAQNDKRAISQITKVKFDVNYYKNQSYSAIRKKFTDKYGGGFKRDGYSFIETLKHILMCPNYTLKEKMNILNGSYYSYQSLARNLATTDIVKLVPKINIPVFVLQGLHDYQTTYTQAKRFYDLVEAPYKKIFIFKDSAHTPFFEERERFREIIENEVLGLISH